jgi:hypothetical protein
VKRTLTDAIADVFSPNGRKCVEPEQRLHGGVFGWVIHRFPIKGGKNMHDTVMRDFGDNIMRSNFLYKKLTEKQQK